MSEGKTNGALPWAPFQKWQWLDESAGIVTVEATGRTVVAIMEEGTSNIDRFALLAQQCTRRHDSGEPVWLDVESCLSSAGWTLIERAAKAAADLSNIQKLDDDSGNR